MKAYALMPFLMAAQSAIAEPMDDPWALVPKLPSSCYSERDDFAARTDTTLETVQAEMARQEEINSAISQQSKDLDPMEIQQRTMDFMMEHPEQAEQLMRGLMQTGQETNEEAPEMNAQRQQLENELSALSEQYDAEYKKLLGPLESRYYGENGADLSESDSRLLVEKMNSAYEGLCKTWWKNGPFHAWLDKEKALLIEDAAVWEKNEKAGTEQKALMLGVNTDGYRSTASLSAARDFTHRAKDIFAKRWLEPRTSMQ